MPRQTADPAQKAIHLSGRHGAFLQPAAVWCSSRNEMGKSSGRPCATTGFGEYPSSIRIFSLSGAARRSSGRPLQADSANQAPAAAQSKYSDSMESSSKEHLKPFAHAAQNRCFGCGPINPIGLHLEFLIAPDGAVVSFPTVGENFEGHPGYLHGGIIATLLDEAMSKAVRALGQSAMTRKMEIDYRRPVPSGVPIRIEGRIVRSEHAQALGRGQHSECARNRYWLTARDCLFRFAPSKKSRGSPKATPMRISEAPISEPC